MAFTTPQDHGQIQPVEVRDFIVIAKDLTKKFGGEYAVRDVSFKVPRGSIFGFIGPSGSGKTTTIRMLLGIYEPSEGEVFVLGKEPNKFTQGMRARIGYMPQLFVLYPNLTIWENLNFAASIYGMSLFRGKRLKQVLEFVELYEHRKKLIREISGGMQRRLSLAATLVHHPELLFLDEPTAGIDPVLRRKLWDHFKHLQSDGRTIFVTTQYVNEAAYCDLVGVMAEGRLLIVDTPDGLRHRAFGGEVVVMRTLEDIDYQVERDLRRLPFIRGSITRTSSKSMRIIVNEAGTAIPNLMDWARDNNLRVEQIEEYLPPFDDVFVELVREKTEKVENE